MSRLQDRLYRAGLDSIHAHRLARILLSHCSAHFPGLVSAASELVDGLDPIQYTINMGSRSIWIFGKFYTLTVPQSRCLDILIPRYKSKQPWVSVAFIEEAVVDPDSDTAQDYREIWRDHDLIKDEVIAHGPRKGTVGIVQPKTRHETRQQRAETNGAKR